MSVLDDLEHRKNAEAARGFVGVETAINGRDRRFARVEKTGRQQFAVEVGRYLKAARRSAGRIA